MALFVVPHYARWTEAGGGVLRPPPPMLANTGQGQGRLILGRVATVYFLLAIGRLLWLLDMAAAPAARARATAAAQPV